MGMETKVAEPKAKEVSLLRKVTDKVKVAIDPHHPTKMEETAELKEKIAIGVHTHLSGSIADLQVGDLDRHLREPSFRLVPSGIDTFRHKEWQEPWKGSKLNSTQALVVDAICANTLYCLTQIDFFDGDFL